MRRMLMLGVMAVFVLTCGLVASAEASINYYSFNVIGSEFVSEIVDPMYISPETANAEGNWSKTIAVTNGTSYTGELSDRGNMVTRQDTKSGTTSPYGTIFFGGSTTTLTHLVTYEKWAHYSDGSTQFVGYGTSTRIAVSTSWWVL